jgi:hypothetical protein
MDYIEGQRLERSGAEMIRQLQSIHLSTPGPIGGGPC